MLLVIILEITAAVLAFVYRNDIVSRIKSVCQRGKISAYIRQQQGEVERQRHIIANKSTIPRMTVLFQRKKEDRAAPGWIRTHSALYGSLL